MSDSNFDSNQPARLSLRDFIVHLPPRRAWLIILAYIIFMVLLGVFLFRAVDREVLRDIVERAGLLGPLAFLVVEYFYVIFVPIYNTAIHLAAGYIFGGGTGWLLNIIATSAGLFTIIGLVKYYGRPLLERVVSKSKIERYDRVASRTAPIVLFLIYALPLFPDDEITYLIAASQTKFSRFVLPVILGTIAKTSVSYIGDEGLSGFTLTIISRTSLLIIGLFLVAVQEYLHHRRIFGS